MSAYVPSDEAVEAAAEALHGCTFHPTPWDELPKWMKDEKRAAAQPALAAAAPHVLAEFEARLREQIGSAIEQDSPGDYFDGAVAEGYLIGQEFAAMIARTDRRRSAVVDRGTEDAS